MLESWVLRGSPELTLDGAAVGGGSLCERGGPGAGSEGAGCEEAADVLAGTFADPLLSSTMHSMPIGGVPAVGSIAAGGVGGDGNTALHHS